MTRSVRSRSAAASSVSSRLQKQKRMYCRPSALSWKKLEPGTVATPDVADEVPGEGDVVLDPEGVDARHDVVGPLGGIELEADVPEHRAEAIAPRLVVGGELGVVLARQPVGHRAGLLERGRGADRDEVVDLAERLRQVAAAR